MEWTRLALCGFDILTLQFLRQVVGQREEEIIALVLRDDAGEEVGYQDKSSHKCMSKRKIIVYTWSTG